MQNLLAGMLAQLSPKTHEPVASRTDLDEIIDRLQRRQVDLEQRLATQADGAEKHRLTIALEVARLQQKKAVELLTDHRRPKFHS